MKDKILAALKAKHPAVNLSKKRLDAIAAKIETLAGTDETLIDAKLDEMNGFYAFADMAKDDDAARNTASKLKKAEDDLKAAGQPKPTPTPGEEVDEIDLPTDTPAYVKLILEGQKKMAGEISVLRGEKQTTAIRTQVEGLLKAVPPIIWADRVMPEKLEDVEAFVQKVTTDYGKWESDMTEKGLLKTGGGNGGGGGGDNTKATDRELDDAFTQIMPNVPVVPAK